MDKAKITMYLSDYAPVIASRKSGFLLTDIVCGLIWTEKPDIEDWRSVAELEITDENYTVFCEEELAFDDATYNKLWAENWHPITWSHDGEYIVIEKSDFLKALKKPDK